MNKAMRCGDCGAFQRNLGCANCGEVEKVTSFKLASFARRIMPGIELHIGVEVKSTEIVCENAWMRHTYTRRKGTAKAVPVSDKYEV